VSYRSSIKNVCEQVVEQTWVALSQQTERRLRVLRKRFGDSISQSRHTQLLLAFRPIPG